MRYFLIAPDTNHLRCWKILYTYAFNGKSLVLQIKYLKFYVSCTYSKETLTRLEFMALISIESVQLSQCVLGCSFYATVFFPKLSEIFRKPEVFWCFQGGTESDQWHKMGCLHITNQLWHYVKQLRGHKKTCCVVQAESSFIFEDIG